jgi:hypothetical protein
MQHAFVDSLIKDTAVSEDDPIIAPLVREQLDELIGGQRDAGVGRPERALMRAMLQDAILCLIGEAAPAKDRAHLASDARYWIESHSLAWVFSFENVCEVLGINADYARRHLLRLADHRQARSESSDPSQPSHRPDGCTLRGLRKSGSRPRRAIHFMTTRRRRQPSAAEG